MPSVRASRCSALKRLLLRDSPIAGGRSLPASSNRLLTGFADLARSNPHPPAIGGYGMKRLRPSATSLRRAATRVSSAGHSFGHFPKSARFCAATRKSSPASAVSAPSGGLPFVLLRDQTNQVLSFDGNRRAFNMARRCSDLQEFWQVKSFEFNERMIYQLR